MELPEGPVPEAELNVFEGLEFYCQPLTSKLQIVDVHVGADLLAFAPFESTEQVASFELEVANLVQNWQFGLYAPVNKPVVAMPAVPAPSMPAMPALAVIVVVVVVHAMHAVIG